MGLGLMEFGRRVREVCEVDGVGPLALGGRSVVGLDRRVRAVELLEVDSEVEVMFSIRRAVFAFDTWLAGSVEAAFLAFLRLADASADADACFAAREAGSVRTSAYSDRIRQESWARSARSEGERLPDGGEVDVDDEFCWNEMVDDVEGSVDGRPRSAAKSSRVRLADCLRVYSRCPPY